MSIRVCALCGKGIRLNGSNYVITDDNKIIHKRCPKDSKNKEEQKTSEELVVLRDKIKYYLINEPAGYLADGVGINWFKCNNQIKDLLSKGYSYQEQLYALEIVVKAMKGFYGYTAVVNRIDEIIDKKRNKESKIVSVSSESQYNANLSKLLNQKEEW